MTITPSLGTTASPFAAQRPAQGHGRVARTIDSEVSAGTLSASDGTALTKALSAIDTSLSADRSAATGAGGGQTGPADQTQRLDPSQLQAKVGGLIDAQVSGGTLTSGQADALKQIFAGGGTDAAQGTAGARKGHGGHRHAADSSASTTDATTSGTSATATDATATGGTTSLLDSFIKQLQATQTTATGYTAPGSAASRSTTSAALLLDFQA